MTVWTKEELLKALNSELLEHHLPENLEIDEVVIDSRKTPKSGLFIALKGEKNDAHDFLSQACDNGCAAVLIHKKSALGEIKNFLLVKDTFSALYKLAEFSRLRSKAKIIAITGSVGKTGTKEMLKTAFSTQGKTFATYGNLNNHIGLPLSLCNFSSACEYGIFEMGMNHAGEIEPLSKLAKPHLAIITTVGPVHIENFKNEEGIALAKAEIFSGIVENGMILINGDNQHYQFLLKQAQTNKIKAENIFSFGKNDGANYQILESKILNAAQAEIFLKLKNNQKISYKISTSNSATIFNSAIVAACLDLLGKDFEKGILSLKQIEESAGRGKVTEIKIDNKNITIIDDSYNASVLSMKCGIEYVTNLKKILGKKRVVAALGDMLELGEKSVELHEEVANYLNQFHIDFAILVGEKMTESSKKLPKNSYKTFLNSTAASLEIKDLLQDQDILYLKGSRGTKMEKLLENLTDQKSVH